MKGKSESEVAQSCPTLRDPMVCSLPGSSVHGIFQARVLEWGVIAFSNSQAEEQEMLAIENTNRNEVGLSWAYQYTGNDQGKKQ